MKVFELVMSGVLALGGVRSLLKWSKRHFASTNVSDQILWALYLTGRVGLWFAFAGFFLIYGLSDAQGRAFIDELERFRWFVMVPVGLAALQLLAGLALGRRSSE